MPENFTHIFSLLQVLQLLQYFIAHFKNYDEEMYSHCNTE